jgi:uncharacterized protein YndB with AHSA1/START domain
MSSFTLKRSVAAPAKVVFDVLADHRGYADITPVRRVDLEREGEPAPNGVGAIRVFHLVGPPLREEVLTYEPPRRLSYRLLSGAPLRDYVGTVELTPEGEGTGVTWAVRAVPTVPVVGPAVVGVAKLAVKQLLNAIVAESERRAASGG